MVIITHHLHKVVAIDLPPSKKWLQGSGNIMAVCRSVWIVDILDFSNLMVRRITLVKTASGSTNQGMAFHMTDPLEGLDFSIKAPKPETCFQRDKMEEWLIVTMLQKELWQKKELLTLASAAGLSAYYLKKLMTQLKGTTITSFIQGRRMYRKLLMETKQDTRQEQLCIL